jgi:FAD/FMN-containing dehydrogenase
MAKHSPDELQRQLLGSVTESPAVRAAFATDASIVTQTPQVVVYPRNTADVRKVVQWAAARAESGKYIGIIPRGLGSDTSGAAVGEGVQLALPAHMHTLLRLRKDTVAVQAGMTYATLQQALHTHVRFIPPAPASASYSTVGGAVANDAVGEYSVKYGSTRDFVKGMKVVLADGSLIETGRISARELHRRKGKTTFEAELYRKLDSLILDNEDIIAKAQPKGVRHAAGYALSQVRGKDGSFDLGQMFIGAQGTLGVITEVTLRTSPWQPRTTLLAGFFGNVRQASDALVKLRKLRPAALELIDGHLLEQLQKHQPEDVQLHIPTPLPKLMILIEFDNISQLSQTMLSRRAERIFSKLGTGYQLATDPVQQVALWKLRRTGAALGWLKPGNKPALPFMDDAMVPPTKLIQLWEQTRKLLAKHDVEAGMWAQAGEARLHVQPALDLAKPKDVNKLFALSHEYAELVIGLGGSPSSTGDGLLHAPYLSQLYGTEMYDLFSQAKAIFDPHNIMNPGKVVNVTPADVRAALRTEYAPSHLNHIPHS